MMRGPQLDAFADRFGLVKISIEEMIDWRKQRGDM
jgi:3,4-dihydroxy-2-butanone 4-phosphate synthase